MEALADEYSLRILGPNQLHRRSDDRNNESPRVPSEAQTLLERPTRKYQMMLLLSGFLMTFHVIGINSVFGIFQELYTSPESNIKDAQRQDALVSLIGTIGSGLTWSGSIFVNPLIARVDNLKKITLPGVVIMSLGLILASFSTKVWQLYFTQAFLYGVGSSMYYFPIMSITPVYFDKHRGFAMGLVLAGSGVGGLVIALVLQKLLDQYGVHWALRILGLWNFAIGIPVACVVQHRPGVGMRGPTRMNLRLAKRGTFLYQASGAFLQAAGNIIPLYYLTSYSVSVLDYSRSTGSLLLAINSGVNSLSRVAMGTLADFVGRQNTTVGSVFLSGLSVFALWYDAPRSRFVAFVIFYGIYAGGYNALLPTTITEIYGVENYANVNGFIYFIRGIGTLFGAPLAGALLGSHKRAGETSDRIGDLISLQKRFNDVAVYAGILLLAAGCCASYVRWLDSREKGRWRWVA